MTDKNKLELWKYYLTTDHFVAVDIGTFGTKIMEVKRRFTTYSIVKVLYLPEMNKFFKGKDIINIKGIIDNIAHMLQVEEIKAKKMILSITSSKIQNKVIKLPDIPEKEMKSYVEIEFQRQFSNSSRISDILDFMKVGKLRHNENISSMVMIATLPISEANNIVQEIESSKFHLHTLDVDAHALGNTGIVQESEHIDRVMLDIGSETSNLVFIRDKAIVFSRPVLYGMSNLAKAIQVEEDISIKDAERIIEETGLIAKEDVLVRGYKTIGKDIYNSIVEDNLGSALNETYRAFQFVNTTLGVDVEEVILTGGFSCLPNAVEMTKTTLDLNVISWSLEKERTIILPNGCKVTNNTGKSINGTFATCFGMAIRGTLR